MPRFAGIFINDADGKPLDEILQRVEDAMRKAGASTEQCMSCTRPLCAATAMKARRPIT
jgi:hypothetical protein